MGRKQKHIEVSWKYVEYPDEELRFERAFDILFELVLEKWNREEGNLKKEQVE